MIHIFYADTGSDSLGILFSEIQSSLKKIRSGQSDAKRVLLIVPAQFTLEAEEAAFRYLGGNGFFDLHIMSNNKLAKEILRETGGMGSTPVNRLGRAMLLRKIAKDHASELDMYAKVANDSAFLDMAGDFLLQLKQNNIDSATLASVTEQVSGSLLERKLRDLQLFCREYQTLTAGKYNDAEDLRAFVTARVKDCRFVCDSEVFFYDFYSFTPRDVGFLEELGAYTQGLHIQLLANDVSPEYEASRRTMRQLRAMGERRNLAVSVQDVCGSLAVRRTPERHLLRCASPFTQAETIAAEIQTLVRDKGYSYRDIVVLTGNLERQGRTLQRVFELSQIPVFLDEKRSIRQDPAAMLLSAVLNIAADGFLSQSVLSILKTGLTSFADPLQTEYFENYCRQYHIYQERFLRPFVYGAKKIGEERLQELESIRVALIASLSSFSASFSSAATAEGKSAVLRNYMENDLQLPDVLQRKSAELAEVGLFDAGEELGQIWDLILELLDQLCELMGSTELSNEEYRDILTSSLSDIRVGLLPQAEGKVLIGDIERSRVSGVRALFIAGFNEGWIPCISDREDILTEEEQSRLEAMGYTFLKRKERYAEEQQLVIRKALDSPTDYLWLGYTVSDSEGNETKASNLLSDLRAEYALTEEEDIENRGDPLALIQTPSFSLRSLSSALRAAVSGEELHDVWKMAYNVLRDQAEPRLDAVTEGLFFDKNVAPIGSDAAAALYGFGTSAACSPSRIETFSGCPFRHFITYGLRPEDQREFEVGAIELGSIYHEVLERFCERLSAPCRAKRMPLYDPASPWMTVSSAEIRSSVSEILSSLEQEAMDGLFSCGKPEQYRAKRVRNVCVKFASQLVRQVRLGKIRDMHLETPFGRGKRFPAVEIPAGGRTIRLEGKIDRVDLLESGGQEYVKIIDYKSGTRSFDSAAAEKGLAVQLMVYLEGALQAYSHAKPAGVFYCLIRDPDAVVSLADIDASSAADELAESFAKDYRLNGLLLNDREAVRGLAPDALTEQGGSVLAVKTDKEGNLKATSSTELLSSEELEELRDRVRSAIRGICERLLQGEIAIAPQGTDGTKKTAPCRFCDYRAICLYE